MSEINEFMIQQIIDNGKNVQISLVENVNTEPISQKQMIRESVIKNIDKETKDQVMPLLDAILQAQPTIKIKWWAVLGVLHQSTVAYSYDAKK